MQLNKLFDKRTLVTGLATVTLAAASGNVR